MEMGVSVGLISVKGGVYKSTLSRSIAVEAAKSSLTCLLADLDLAQGTALDWARRRLSNDITPTITVQPFKNISQALAHSDSYDIIIADTPGRVSEGTQRIAEAVDLVIQPTSPSLDDLTPAVRLFHELVKVGIPRKKLYMAMTNVLTEAEEAAGRDYIAQAGHAVLEGSIPSRASLRDVQNSGRAIQESRYPALNERIDVLLQAIVDKLEF